MTVHMLCLFLWCCVSRYWGRSLECQVKTLSRGCFTVTSVECFLCLCDVDWEMLVHFIFAVVCDEVNVFVVLTEKYWCISSLLWHVMRLMSLWCWLRNAGVFHPCVAFEKANITKAFSEMLHPSEITHFDTFGCVWIYSTAVLFF